MLPQDKLLEIIRIQTDTVRLGADLGGVMELIVERTLDLVQADGAAIELAEGDDMVYRAASGLARGALGLRLKRDSSISGLCVKLDVPCRCDDTELDPRVDREACRRVGVRSLIVLPLRHGETTVGVLKAMSSQPGRFDDSHVALLEQLCGLVAAAMFYATRYDVDALFHRATHDPMTNLANRSLFMDRLRCRVQQRERDGMTCGVLIIDMDGLKQTNDTYGHRAGDALLTEFARRLRDCARRSDTVARLGGDEFGIVLTPVSADSGIGIAERRIQTVMRSPFEFEGTALSLNASMGGALCPNEAASAEQLIDLADCRMYEAKRQRKAEGPPLRPH